MTCRTAGLSAPSPGCEDRPESHLQTLLNSYEKYNENRLIVVAVKS